MLSHFSSGVAYLQRNLFTGSIPDTLSSWAGAAEISYFHGNNLTGSLDIICDKESDGPPMLRQPPPSGGPGGGPKTLDLWADCEDVSCPCCSYCCSNAGTCEWLGRGEDIGERPIKSFEPR